MRDGVRPGRRCCFAGSRRQRAPPKRTGPSRSKGPRSEYCLWSVQGLIRRSERYRRRGHWALRTGQGDSAPLPTCAYRCPLELLVAVIQSSCPRKRSCDSQPQFHKVVDAMLPDPINTLGGFVAQVVAAKVAAEEQHERHVFAIGSLKLVDLGGFFLPPLVGVGEVTC